MISVIISAHDRKKYLLNAIKSVIHQTLDPNKYEIIVVKNFNDEVIDGYIQTNGITSIYTNEATLSGKIIEGLKVCKYDIISFLDDDDIFFENKLKRISEEFSKDNCIYIHNDIQAINDGGDFIYFKDNRTSFNMSSISVKKEIINIDILKESPFNLDSLMYAFALEFGGKTKDLTDKLTYYRVHYSVTHIFADFEEYKSFYVNSVERSLKAYNSIFKSFSSKNATDFLKHEISFLQIRLKIYKGDKIYMKEYIQFLLTGHLFKNTRFEYKLVIGSIIFRKSIVKKLFRNELNKINKTID
jgi:glycosyltransferase involved in cell wall biosynthesis